MFGWVHLSLVVAAMVLLLVLLLLFILRYGNPKQPPTVPSNPTTGRVANLETGIAKLHHVSTTHHHHDNSSTINNNSKRLRTNNYYVFRRGVSPSAKPLFSWADNPSLVTDAVENGWSRFAFATAYTTTSSPSVRSSARALLGACAGDRDADRVEVSWEVSQGSADFMQKIRLNSGLKKIANTSSPLTAAATSVIKTSLPLPGPPLGNSSAFPQEAYFEITILSNFHEDQNDDLFGKVKRVGKGEGEKTKLIQEGFNYPRTNSESLVHVKSGSNNIVVEELRNIGSTKINNVDGRLAEVVVLSVGLTGGGSLPLKLPGNFQGSIGFNSNGSVYLDGIKLVSESEKEDWGRTDKVIGCGYNPSQSKVFFTVDSELVHEIHCKSEEFGTPLYPTLAANADIAVLVNFGQSVFKYAPANQQRTPNPCFIGPMANSPALGYEDSKELFSMGRIDSQWLNRSATRSTQINIGSHNRGADFDEMSEGDLFEIILDSSGRSPNPNSGL